MTEAWPERKVMLHEKAEETADGRLYSEALDLWGETLDELASVLASLHAAEEREQALAVTVENLEVLWGDAECRETETIRALNAAEERVTALETALRAVMQFDAQIPKPFVCAYCGIMVEGMAHGPECAWESAAALLQGADK